MEEVSYGGKLQIGGGPLEKWRRSVIKNRKMELVKNRKMEVVVEKTSDENRKTNS